MTLTIEPTDRIIQHDGRDVRVWKGTSGRGVPVFVLVARVAVHSNEDSAEFERELIEVEPSLDVALQLVNAGVTALAD